MRLCIFSCTLNIWDYDYLYWMKRKIWFERDRERERVHIADPNGRTDAWIRFFILGYLNREKLFYDLSSQTQNKFNQARSLTSTYPC